MARLARTSGSLRIVVLGYVVRGPLGGMVWSDLHYLLGLAEAGHDVYFLEDSDDYPSCYDPSRYRTDTDPTYGLAFASRVLDRVGFGDRWAYHDAHTASWHGPLADRALSVARSADVLLNLANVNPIRPWLEEIPVRVLVDQDPAFTQVRHLADPAARDRALAHTFFASFGELAGTGAGEVPDDGLPWVPTRQPVVLDAVPVSPPRPDGALTTVMQWSSYPPREHDGRRYGMKSDSLRQYLDLPSATGASFELAVGGADAPREELESHGWALADAEAVSSDPWTYEAFVRESKGEFSVAKHGYVVSRSGWFSERSAFYLATGRPAVLQDTGFSDWLPVGEGVLAFSTPGEARDAVADLERGYARHCAAARELVEAYFDSGAVLASLLERATSPLAAAASSAPSP